jgi:hypothetical protein
VRRDAGEPSLNIEDQGSTASISHGPLAMGEFAGKGDDASSPVPITAKIWDFLRYPARGPLGAPQLS